MANGKAVIPGELKMSHKHTVHVCRTTQSGKLKFSSSNMGGELLSCPITAKRNKRLFVITAFSALENIIGSFNIYSTYIYI